MSRPAMSVKWTVPPQSKRATGANRPCDMSTVTSQDWSGAAW